jgi:hypothetical protein
MPQISLYRIRCEFLSVEDFRQDFVLIQPFSVFEAFGHLLFGKIA